MGTAYRFYIVRKGILRRDLRLMPQGGPRVTMASDAVIKTALRGRFAVREGVDLMHDRLRAVMLHGGHEQDIGEFVVTTCRTLYTGGQAVWELEAYDQTYLIRRTRQEQRLALPAGEGYLAAVQGLLMQCGIRRIAAEPSDAVLQTGREWELGEQTLTIVNTLLHEMGYRSLWFDGAGYARLTRSRPPSLDAPHHRYHAHELSVLMQDCESSWDIFDAKNVFVAIVDTPYYKTPLIARAENDDVRSPVSTVNLGRLMAPVIRLDNIASQQALEEYVQMVRFESMLCTQTVCFTTANRIHGIWELTALEHPQLSGIFEEVAWEMVLEEGAAMRHTARRVIV